VRRTHTAVITSASTRSAASNAGATSATSCTPTDDSAKASYACSSVEINKYRVDRGGRGYKIRKRFLLLVYSFAIFQRKSAWNDLLQDSADFSSLSSYRRTEKSVAFADYWKVLADLYPTSATGGDRYCSERRLSVCERNNRIMQKVMNRCP